MMSYKIGYDISGDVADDKDTVGAMSDTVGVMSCLKWMSHHKYCGLV